MSNDHEITPSAFLVVRCSALNKWSVHLCALIAGSYSHMVAVDLLFRLFNYRRGSRLPVPTETHRAVITLISDRGQGKCSPIGHTPTHTNHVFKYIHYILCIYMCYVSYSAY